MFSWNYHISTSHIHVIFSFDTCSLCYLASGSFRILGTSTRLVCQRLTFNVMHRGNVPPIMWFSVLYSINQSKVNWYVLYHEGTLGVMEMLYILMGTERAVVKVNEVVEVKLLKGSFMCCVQLLQSCPTLCDPMDGSPPGSSVCGGPCKNTGVGHHALQESFLTQGLNPYLLHLLHYRQILYHGAIGEAQLLYASLQISAFMELSLQYYLHTAEQCIWRKRLTNWRKEGPRKQRSSYSMNFHKRLSLSGCPVQLCPALGKISLVSSWGRKLLEYIRNPI